MGKVYKQITESIQSWIEEQNLFFVASAAGNRGHINISPKGHAKDSFRILAPLRVAYLDLTGSGSETIAHCRSDGRITILFVALNGKPKIVRLFGKASAIPKRDLSNEQLSLYGDKVVNSIGLRAMIKVEITRVSTSCGFSIPIFTYTADRDALEEWANNKGKEDLRKYACFWNTFSIDGLPSLEHRLMSNDGGFVIRRLQGGYWHPFNNWTLSEALLEFWRLPAALLPRICEPFIPSWRDLSFGVLGVVAAVGYLQKDKLRFTKAVKLT